MIFNVIGLTGVGNSFEDYFMVTHGWLYFSSFFNTFFFPQFHHKEKICN